MYYIHPQKTWDAKKCERLARHTAKDGMGTKYHFKGYLGSSASIPVTFGLQEYNGGCIHNGEWYKGEIRLFPKLAEGYEIVIVPSWGYRIQKIGQNDGLTVNPIPADHYGNPDRHTA